EGDPMRPGAWTDAVADCDAVIHLAGENIFGKRWGAAFKQLLHDSRVRGTENVVAALSRNPRTADGRPRVLVSASAIGWYGPHGDEELTEDAPPGDDFLARVCVDWERAARAAEPLGVRVALVRVGVVLDREGGALAQLLTPFKLGLGGPVGWTPWSGRQYLSWIHHADMVGLFLLALDNPGAAGPLNGTAPHPVTNREFGKALGRALHRPAFLPVPPLALRLMLGEVAHIVATGQRVLPKRPLALGYAFRFPTIDAALADILK
ncbi:MAG TPA: TIGR01777 family oxidoreductase, partial [Gemmataceae bacterium]|nr:TIGR01777 family oxidoreductase [Gemmataceae bacterium]